MAHSLSFPEEENHNDEEDHDEPGYVVVHVEEEGDYGFAVPSDVEFFILAEEPGAFEWAGMFQISDTSHTWSMQQVDGAYADPSMRLVLIPTTTPDEPTIHTLEDAATTLIEGEDCTVVEDTESITSIASDGSCFELHVGTGDDSSYTIDTTGLTGLAVFAQHVPIEFERDQHYLKNSAGEDVEPAAEESTILETIGGAENLTTIREWAQAELDQDEIDAYNEEVNSGDYTRARNAVQSMFFAYNQAVGQEPSLLGGKISNNATDVYRSVQEVEAAMNDPRYLHDTAYTRDVEEKVGRSDVLTPR